MGKIGKNEWRFFSLCQKLEVWHQRILDIVTIFSFRPTTVNNGVTAFAVAAAAGRNSLTGYFDGSC